MLARAREALLRRRGVAATLAVLAALAAAAGMQHLSFTTDYRAFFSEDNPDLAQLEFIEANFARAETLVITLAPEDGAVFDNATLEAVRWLSNEALRLPYAKGVSSLTGYHPARGEGDELIIEPMVPDRQLSAEELEVLRAEALGDERITNIILAADGETTGLIAHFELPHERPEQEIQQVADATRAMMRDFAERDFADDINLAVNCPAPCRLRL